MKAYLYPVLLVLPLFVSCSTMNQTCTDSCDAPEFPGVTAAVQAAIDRRDISGAVTVVVTKDKVLDLQAIGMADIKRKKPMRTNSVFAIASMTKLVTAVAVLMSQDDGKLNVNDPVAKYIPEFANLKTPSGRPANLTIKDIMTHTSGLGEADTNAVPKARTLADLIPLYLAAPMQYEPRTKWKYTQSGINTAGRIVEITSGMPYDEFVQERILGPLGMKDTAFYPDRAIREHMVINYLKNTNNGALKAGPPPKAPGSRNRPPMPNGGLYSSGPDYARFCQMLLNEGALEGRRYLSPEAFHLMTSVQTGDLPCGFFQDKEVGNYGANYGWGIGTCILRAPHPGAAAMLSPGSFGHGGAYGTQAWMDPVRKVGYVLMIQRLKIGNSDASAVRRDFQQAAFDSLGK